jgi:hypothetical protein
LSILQKIKVFLGQQRCCFCLEVITLEVLNECSENINHLYCVYGKNIRGYCFPKVIQPYDYEYLTQLNAIGAMHLYSYYSVAGQIAVYFLHSKK